MNQRLSKCLNFFCQTSKLQINLPLLVEFGTILLLLPHYDILYFSIISKIKEAYFIGKGEQFAADFCLEAEEDVSESSYFVLIKNKKDRQIK